MNGLTVLMCVGVTTLTAAIVTLFTLATATTRLEHRSGKRRYRTLAGPVPGHQSLSSIGVNTESARGTPATKQTGQQAITPAEIHQEPDHSLPASPSLVRSTPPDRETNVNPVQSNRAPSPPAADDIQQARPADTEPAPAANAESTQRTNTPDLSAPEDASSTAFEMGLTETQGIPDSAPPRPAPDAESPKAAPTRRTSASKRAKRSTLQAEAPEPPPPAAPEDILPDFNALMESLEMIPPSPNGAPSTPEDSVLDLFTGLSQADIAIQELTTDLDAIDGGGLPVTTRKVPQRSRR